MNATTPIWCVVPAAGVGKRFGSAIPKQYLTLDGKTVCEHTLERLLRVASIGRIVVCLSAEDQFFLTLPVSSQARVVTTLGGAERCHSVLHGLHALADVAGDDDWVLVHDVARPCVRPQDIETLIQQVQIHNAIGGILASPVRDTMKRANGHRHIVDTVSREQLWHALTPQMFPLGLLRDAIESALAQQALVTDESSAMERLGHQPLLVEGHPDNIKITHQQDLPLAALFIQQQESI